MPTRKAQESPGVAGTLGTPEKPLDGLYRLSSLISQSQHLIPVLQSVLDPLLALTKADIGSLHLLDPDSHQLNLVASRGVSRGFLCAEQSIPVGECLCGEAARMGCLMESSDLTVEPRLTRQACRDEKFGSVVSLPLTSQERVVGMLTIYSKQSRAFTGIDHEVLRLVARQIGMAIDNAQLYARMQDAAVVRERGLIAQELHDNIAQSLAYLNLETKKMEQLLASDHTEQAQHELAEIRQVIGDIYQEVRQLLVDFRTNLKEEVGLVETVRRHLRDFERRTGIRTTLCGDERSPGLPPDVQAQLFRMVQEALANVRKHAQAREVTVSLSREPLSFAIVVTDDGMGFEPEAVLDHPSHHVGLKIMRERAAFVCGQLSVESGLGRGTTLRVTVPIGPPPEQHPSG